MTTETAKKLKADPDQNVPAPVDMPALGESVNLDASEN